MGQWNVLREYLAKKGLGEADIHSAREDHLESFRENPEYQALTEEERVSAEYYELGDSEWTNHQLRLIVDDPNWRYTPVNDRTAYFDSLSNVSQSMQQLTPDQRAEIREKYVFPEGATTIGSYEEAPSDLSGIIEGAVQRGAEQARLSYQVLSHSMNIGDVNVDDISHTLRSMRQIPVPEGVSEAGAAQSVGQWFAAVAKNPTHQVDTMVSSAIASIGTTGLSGALGGAAGATVGGPAGAFVGGAAGGAAGTLLLEGASSYFDYLEQQGINVEDPNELKLAISDKRLNAAAKLYAGERAVPIAVMDALTMGLSGIATPAAAPVKSGVMKWLGGIVAHTALDAGGEMAGEALAQLLADGRLQAGAILSEGLAGIATGPAQSAIGIGLRRGMDRAKGLISEVSGPRDGVQSQIEEKRAFPPDERDNLRPVEAPTYNEVQIEVPMSLDVASSEQIEAVQAIYESSPLQDDAARELHAARKLTEDEVIERVAEEQDVTKDQAEDIVVRSEVIAEDRSGTRIARDVDSKVKRFREIVDKYKQVLSEKANRIKGVQVSPNQIQVSEATTNEQKQVEKVANDRGKKIVWFQSNAPIEGIKIEPGVIALQANANPRSNLKSVMVHELAHSIKDDNPVVFDSLVNELKRTPHWEPAEAEARSQLAQAEQPTTSDLVNEETVSYIATNNADAIWGAMESEPDSGIANRFGKLVDNIVSSTGLRKKDVAEIFAPAMTAPMPVTPGAPMPAAPGASVPVTPGVSVPVTPGASAPGVLATPGAPVPVTPGAPMPAAPGTPVPVTPGTPMPATPGAAPGTAPVITGTPAPVIPRADEIEELSDKPKDKKSRQERFKLTSADAVNANGNTAPALVLKEATKAESFGRYWTMEFESLRRMQRSIAGGTGEYAEVDEAVDTFLHAEAYSAKVSSALADAQENVDKLNEVIKAERPSNVSVEEWMYEDIDLFLQARTAHERNVGIYRDRYLKPKQRYNRDLNRIETKRTSDKRKLNDVKRELGNIDRNLNDAISKIEDKYNSNVIESATKVAEDRRKEDTHEALVAKEIELRDKRINKAIRIAENKRARLQSQISNINDTISKQTNREKDLRSKLEGLENIREKASKGSGMSSGLITDEDNVSAEVLSGFRDRGLVDWVFDNDGRRVYSGSLARVASAFDSMTAHKLEALKSSGIISEDQYNAFKSKYRYYAPLKGVRDSETPLFAYIRDYLDGGDKGSGIGGKFQVRTERRALGRESERPAPIVPNAVADYQSAIVRAEKSVVGRSLLNFARTYKGAKNTRGQNLFEINKIRNQKFFDKNSGEIRDRSYLVKDGALLVVEDGEQYFITINDSTLQSAIMNMGADHSNEVVKMLGNVLRFLGRQHTQYNPAFTFPNVARDIGTAAFTLQREETKAIAATAIAKTPHRIKEVVKILYGKDSELKPMWDRYRKAGGKIEFWTMLQPEKTAQQTINAIKDLPAATPHAIEKLVDRAPWILRKTASGVARIADHMENLNTAAENGIRFSTFIECINAGMSDTGAGRVARNVTIDFTRKGSGDFAGLLRQFYLFMNANAQGVRQILATAQHSPRARGMMIGLAIFGFGYSYAMRLLMGEDPEDGEDYYDKIPSYVKERNMIVPAGDGNYAKLPLPYGFHLPYVIGSLIADANFSDRVTAMDATLGVTNSTFESFNPIGSNSLNKPLTGAFQMATPSLVDPLADIVVNQNFWGGPIKPDPSPFLETKPVQSELYFNSSSKSSREFSKRMNEFFGGSPVESSGPITDVSPEIWDHLVKSYSGGAANTLYQSLGQIAKLVDGEEVNAANLPVINRFWGEETEWFVPQMYYMNMEEVAQKKASHDYLLENYPDQADEYYQRNKKLIDIYSETKKLQKDVGDLSKEDKQEAMKRFNKSMRELMFN